MQITAELPLHGDFARPEVIARLARAYDDAGFAGIGVTDHPAPSRKWMEAGGHPSYDPFAALAFCAAVTSRVRLMTYLAVLPYRHPMMVRNLAATLACLSDGRFTMVVGSGYLRSEFAAVGADFDRRGEATDRALEVLDQPYDQDVTVEGEAGRSWAVAGEPAPAAPPDLWIGGTGRTARRRVVEHGTGWSPILQDAGAARTTRSGEVLSTFDDLGRAVRELRDDLLAAGRDPDAVAVQVDAHHTLVDTIDDPDDHNALRDDLTGRGVTQLVLRPGTDDVDEAVDLITAYGRRFLAGR